MKKYSLPLILFSLLFFSSCEYKIIEQAPEPVNFAEQLEPVIAKRCATNCHNAINPILTVGSAYSSLTEGNYINLNDPAESPIYKKSFDYHGNIALSLADQDLLLRWIEEGASAEVTLTSFSNEVEPLFLNKCITCHSSINPVMTAGNAYTSLTEGNYVDTENPEQSVIYQKVASGHGGLTPAEMAILLKWIKEGAQDN